MPDDYDESSIRIVSTALAAWVGNLDETMGLGDAEFDPRYQTKRRGVQDAVNATYHEGITDDDWLAATLRRMEGK
jgi:hypothetical protein